MKIGIIGAMDHEVALLKERLEDASVREAAGMQFCSGLLGKHEAVVAKSGIGKVNAAVCAQAMIDLLDVTHVINTGAAGSLDASIDIGDIVVSTDAVYHDVDVTNFGYAPGQVPRMEPTFPADPVLTEAIAASVAAVVPDIHVFRGRVLTGDQFVRTDEVKQRIRDLFGGLCCEQEGAAIAQTCRINGVPFAIVRAISDKADGSDAMNYDEFEVMAAERSAQIVAHALEMLPA
ncbi:MAG: 5'-methylthioadenosine/adenosylhomocysteine nucleosidase [Coriobacteriales bacterium]|jgi:adenosylhomocysteine nucleosidase